MESRQQKPGKGLEGADRLTEKTISHKTEQEQWETALKKTEANFRAVFENKLQGIILLDKDHTVKVFNQAAFRVFGEQLREGDIIHTYFPHENQSELNDILAKTLQGQSVRLEKKLEIYNKYVWFELDFSPIIIDADQITGVCLSFIDVTKLRETVEILTESGARLLAEMQSVLVVSRALLSELNLTTLLEFIITQAEHLMNAEGAAVFLVSEDGRQLEIATPGETGARMKPGSTFPIKNSLAELAFSDQKVQISNCSDNARSIPIYTLLPSVDCYLLCAPLIAAGKNLGVLLIWNDKNHIFTTNDSRLISLFSDQAALALNNARLHSKNRALAIEQERQRLARDLHDSVNQSLYSIGLAAASVSRSLKPEADSNIREAVEYIRMLAQATSAEIREQLHQLHPTVLAENGLIGALEQYCRVLANRYYMRIELEQFIEPNLPLSQKNELYRIAREAVWNSVKHAKADLVRIDLSTDSDQITLTITDNGIGFDTKAETVVETFGLRNMKERAELLHGRLDIHSGPETGTQLTVQIPQTKPAPVASEILTKF